MRYFLTGATGFLGGHLARMLRSEGHDVVALVRNRAGAEALVEMGVEVVEGDITDPESLGPPMRGADGVFHLAAWYKVGERNAREKAEEINVRGTRNVLDAMRDARIPKGVYTSSLAVFSDTGGVVRDESYRFEGDHLSLYDETKWRAHYEVALPMMEDGLPLVIVQPGAVYGPGDTSQLGGLFSDFLHGRMVQVPKDLTLCWAHVEDVAKAHLLAMEKGRPNESYIVCGPCHTVGDAMDVLAALTGRRPPRIRLSGGLLKGLAGVMGLLERVAPVPADFSAESLRVAAGSTYLGDNTKARQELGYQPRSLEEGFRDTFL